MITSIKKGNSTLTPSSGVVTIPEDASPTENSTNFVQSGGVYTAINTAKSACEPKIRFDTTSTTSNYSATPNLYTVFTSPIQNIFSYSITSVTALNEGATNILYFTVGENFTRLDLSCDNTTFKYMKDFNLEKGKTYEVVALYIGSVWLVTATEFE